MVRARRRLRLPHLLLALQLLLHEPELLGLGLTLLDDLIELGKQVMFGR